MEDDGKRYSCICPICKKEFFACKSIAHTFGLGNCGHAGCIHCGAFLNLEYDSKKDKMVAIEWDEYIKNRSQGQDIALLVSNYDTLQGYFFCYV